MGRDKRKNPYARADQFAQRARKEGYPARSVYKLEEIDRRVNVFKKGQRVLDLGCAPGSWLMYAAQKVGPGGRVRGIDLKGLEVALPPNALAIAGDAMEPSPESEAFLREAAPYDVVISDMAPSTSGTPFADQARSAELVSRTLDVADQWLVKGGTWIAKLFMSEALVELRKRVREMFNEERIIRPEGTRQVSSEVFLIGLGKRAEPKISRNADAFGAASLPASAAEPPTAAPVPPASAPKERSGASAPRRGQRTPKG
jgi:23S rRNA (uridine2552-2'-O)-methyltransferase